METFLKDNFISSDSLSPPSPWPHCYGLLALVQYHESLHSLTFGVLSINPTLSYHGPFALCELQSGLGLLYSFCLTAISDELDDALHVSSLTLRGTTWSEPSGICGISQRWRLCFPSLGTGTVTDFQHTRLFYYWIQRWLQFHFISRVLQCVSFWLVSMLSIQ